MRQFVFIFFLLAAVGCSQIGKDTQSGKDIGKLAFTDLNGNKVKLSEFEGKVVFVNFWATWCRPCLEEMPGIMRMRDNLPSDKIAFLFASDEDADQISSFIEKRNFKGNFVIATNEPELGIQALPTTFIFDQSGKKVFSEVGYKNWEEPSATSIVTDLLK